MVDVSLSVFFNKCIDRGILFDFGKFDYTSNLFFEKVVNTIEELKFGNTLFFLASNDQFLLYKLSKNTQITAIIVPYDTQLDLYSDLPILKVSNYRLALSIAAELSYDNPSKDLKLVGVTGTNGKTTVSWMISHLIDAIGLLSASLGTLGIRSPNNILEQKKDLPTWSLTTEGALNISSTLNYLRLNNYKVAALEVSSHSLVQDRVSALSFDSAVFTNLTQDHLDFHLTMENYRDAKWTLFELLRYSDKENKISVVNVDDPTGSYFSKKLTNCLTYGFSDCSDLRISSFSSGQIELFYQDKVYRFDSPFTGLHNVYNLVAALSVGIALEYNLIDLIQNVSKLPEVPGRLEKFSNNKISVYVDYAHTPDALHRAIEALRPEVKNGLIVVFGCGGDRDRSKRPLMMNIAETYGDKVIVTSDNPRTEFPEDIINDILSGATLNNKILVEPDRETAIKFAIKNSNKGDVVLIAGKGHEDYQIIGNEKIRFIDQEIVIKYLIN
jgi:UDP-N-acetylmuramoyl-L-alanyl-D-glutamate--2,6-diaminopimelate ligase